MKVIITQDLSEVKSKEFYGFTRKQFIGLVVSASICLPTYWFINMISGTDSAMLLVCLFATPILFYSFFKIRNLPPETFLRQVYLHKIVRTEERKRKGTYEEQRAKDSNQ